VAARVCDVIRTGDRSTRWVIAGHSVGGVVTCRIASEHAELLSGIALLGTVHPRDVDLSHLVIPVTKVTATNDGLATSAEVRANAKKLPPQTRWIEIEGGNHSQFGYYGFQLGDNRAAISREVQQAQTVNALLELLDGVAAR
jgi:pimeloyl-ACP methyl ester carboxylesterase